MGSKFIVADPGLCIGCKTCMAACLSKHDVAGDTPKARLNLVTTLAVSAPIVCHHCVEAPCVAACPEGALYFDQGRVAVANERCIGCRSCVMACPYGAVDVVSTVESVKFGNLTIGEKPKASVIKCDLCYDRPGGSACVAACPTGGLKLVDKDDLEQSTREKRTAAAQAAESISSVALNADLSQ